MASVNPPQLDAAKLQLAAALEAAEKRPVDLLKESWADIEKGVIKLLGGPFRGELQQHQVIALGLAGALGERLAAEDKAFWFPSRESPEGASLGFPEALIMLSPFGAVVDALAAAKLSKLDELAKDIRGSLAKVRFSASAQQPLRLTPVDYMRLFDPGFVQLVQIDAQKAQAGLSLTPERAAAELRTAFGRLGTRIPADVAKQLETQLLQTFSRLEPGKPLEAQAQRAPRLGELVIALWGTVGGTGAAPEEFWEGNAFPLLFVGVPQSFPPLGEDELAMVRQGVDPLLLFLDVVPYQFKAPEEDGLYGAFALQSLQPPHPSLASGANPRLFKVGLEALREPLAKFDAKATRAAIERFYAEVKAKVPTAPPAPTGEPAEVLEAALHVLTELKGLVAGAKGELCVRRMTEAEASQDLILGEVRAALNGPRIIL